MLEFVITADIKELGKINLPDPDTLNYYNRLENRELFINYDIDEGLVEFSYDIMRWNREDKGIPTEKRKPIKIFINSDGGCLNSVLNFINTIKLSKTPIITIGMGKVYSAGGLLLMAGHKRYIFHDTTFLLHDGSSGAIGSVGKLMDGLEFTQKTEKRVKEYVLSHTGIDSDLYDKNYRRDWFMLSDEMIKYNVADKIITDLDEIL